MATVRWGILSTARIAQQVIGAVRAVDNCDVVAAASRDLQRAKQFADANGLPRAHGDYGALLADPDVDAVYIPLPNHIHVPWAIKAIEAGKHVLCEKPVSTDAAGAQQLADAASKDPSLKVMEAYMYRFHPQWEQTRKLVDEGALGELVSIDSCFGFYTRDPDDIRNQKAMGSGSLLDLGCYSVSSARLLTGREPSTVRASFDMDPEFDIERRVSAILDFDGPVATFTASTQVAFQQRVLISGSEGTLELSAPFIGPGDQPRKIKLRTNSRQEDLETEAVDQYALEFRAFSQSVLDDTEVPIPLSESVANMKAMDAVRQAAETGETVQL